MHAPVRCRWNNTHDSWIERHRAPFGCGVRSRELDRPPPEPPQPFGPPHTRYKTDSGLANASALHVTSAITKSFFHCGIAKSAYRNEPHRAASDAACQRIRRGVENRRHREIWSDRSRSAPIICNRSHPTIRDYVHGGMSGNSTAMQVTSRGLASAGTYGVVTVPRGGGAEHAGSQPSAALRQHARRTWVDRGQPR